MIWARDTGSMEEDLDELVFRKLERQEHLRWLFDLHPGLFPNGAEPSRSWLPTGWFGLLDRLCTAIGQKLVTSGEPSVRVTVVGEKFGLLKFGVEPVGFGRAIAQLVEHARSESSCTCEYCGGLGHLRDPPTIAVLCGTCLAARDKRCEYALERLRSRFT